MHNDLKIPFAGSRDSGEGFQGYLGGSAHLWSSSPASNSESRDLYRNVSGEIRDSDDDMSMENDYRAYAYSVRCFYNEYDEYEAPVPASKTITYHPN